MKNCIEIDGHTYSFRSINSLTFKKDIRNILKYVSKPDKDFKESVGKISAMNFLGSKLTLYYKLPQPEYDTIKKEYNNILENDTYLQDTLKTAHSRFLNEKLSYDISNRIYTNRYTTYNPLMFLMILKHLLRSNRATAELKIEIKNELVGIFNTPGTNIEIKREIADILLNAGFTEEGNRLLDILRRDEENIIHTVDVYKDSQNVHNSTINQSVLSAGENLIQIIDLLNTYSAKLKTEEDPDEISYLRSSLTGVIKDITSKTLNEVLDILPVNTDNAEEYLTRKYPKNSYIIKLICDRLVFDTSIFSSYSLSDIFSALWTLISIHHNKDDLMDRLMEEMLEMNTTCTTGHLSRFINVIQGYVTNDKLLIKMSNYDSFKASCIFYLNKNLQDAPDEVQDSMFEDKVLFYEYVLKLIQRQLPVWKKENGPDTINMVLKVLKEYTQHDFSEEFISLNIN